MEASIDFRMIPHPGRYLRPIYLYAKGRILTFSDPENMHTQEILKAFADATQSLKLYRRAELRDENTDAPLIEHLYVDPLQNNAVLEMMMRPNTTLVIGRKGTGKSTVFQRAQYEIRKNKRHLSAYIDIKTR
jgi:hypothetical protein